MNREYLSSRLMLPLRGRNFAYRRRPPTLCLSPSREAMPTRALKIFSAGLHGGRLSPLASVFCVVIYLTVYDTANWSPIYPREKLPRRRHKDFGRLLPAHCCSGAAASASKDDDDKITPLEIMAECLRRSRSFTNDDYRRPLRAGSLGRVSPLGRSTATFYTARSRHDFPEARYGEIRD